MGEDELWAHQLYPDASTGLCDGRGERAQSKLNSKLQSHCENEPSAAQAQKRCCYRGENGPMAAPTHDHENHGV